MTQLACFVLPVPPRRQCHQSMINDVYDLYDLYDLYEI